MGTATGKGLSALMCENVGIRPVTFAMLALLVANGGPAIATPWPTRAMAAERGKRSGPPSRHRALHEA